MKEVFNLDNYVYLSDQTIAIMEKVASLESDPEDIARTLVAGGTTPDECLTFLEETGMLGSRGATDFMNQVSRFYRERQFPGPSSPASTPPAP